ncbi:PhoH family protein [Bartonella sp. DGB1]|uniref:PhoH family protein n=1 Tax=Bartonella sp. DGB1 TaxID=3239807 RepID=UPI0035232591
MDNEISCYNSTDFLVNIINSNKLMITIASNNYAQLMIGQYSENFKYLEETFNIEIEHTGNHIYIFGDTKNIYKALSVLKQLYFLISSGSLPSLNDIKGLIAVENTQIKKNKSNLNLSIIETQKKRLIARSERQSQYINALKNHDLVFGVGPAGTGKTYLAVAHAAMLLEQGKIERIILSRPAVEAGEKLGFLPGDMKEKIDPYLRPLYDSLYDMLPHEKIEKYLEAGIIEIAPLAFMRGRTLRHAAIILDEAQNTSSTQMKMFLTRLGEGSRMIVTGDPSQIDLPNTLQSGLLEALKVLDKISNIKIIHFTDEDVIRHSLVGQIIKAYNNFFTNNNKD